MRKLLLLFILIIMVASCGSIKRHNSQITKLHPVESLHDDVDRLYKQLKKHHPRLYQYTSKKDLEFKFDSLKKTIQVPITSRDFYKKMAPVLSSVRQGHVSISSVNKKYTKKERKQLLKKKFDFYNLQFEYLEDKLWVKNTFGKDTTLLGAEVLSIDDTPVLNLVNTYKKRFASDGYNTTLHNRFVGKGFQNFYVKDKGFLDSLKVTFKSIDSVFVRVLKRVSKKEKKPKKQKNDTVAIKKLKPPKISKDVKKANKLATKKKRKDDRKYGFIGKTKQYTRNFNFIGKDSTIAYMKLRSFTNGKYKKFYKESFEKIKETKTDYFVLDLRDNGGGRIAEIGKLYSYLTGKDYQFVTESEVNSRIPVLKSIMSNTIPNSVKIVSGLFSPFIIAQNLIRTKKKDGKLYYKFGQSKLKKPNALNYKGKMYVLINGNSFSASSIISTHLKATHRATFVGEETGGAYNGCVAGMYKIYELPESKLKVRMGLMQVEAPQKQNPDGYGIIPDVKILPTVKDRSLKKDTELEWILEAIYKKK